MKLFKKLTTVKPFSKYLALSLFVILPFLTFIFGLSIGKPITSTTTITSNEIKNTPYKQAPSTITPKPKIIQMKTIPIATYNLTQESPTECNNTFAVYSDPDKEEPGVMIITNKNLSETQAYLDGKMYKTEDGISTLVDEFRYQCSGFASHFIKDIPISYPGTDKARALMSMVGHDPWGTVMVAVFAKKGDEFINLRIHLHDPAFYEKYYNGCSNEDFSCYRQNAFTDPFLTELSTRYAKGLVKTFRLTRN